MGDFQEKTPLSMRVWSSSAHLHTRRASECKPDGYVPGKGTSKRDRSGKGVQARAAFSANRVASGSQISDGAGRKSFRRIFSTLLALAVLVHPAPAHAKCHTHRCWAKVSHRRHVAYAWRWIKAYPMPYCTWAYESGTYGSPWRHSRYRARNRSSTAGGKFQILDRTWYAYGGSHYNDSHPAAVAPPLEQEKIARRVLANQGIHAWVGC